MNKTDFIKNKPSPMAKPATPMKDTVVKPKSEKLGNFQDANGYLPINLPFIKRDENGNPIKDDAQIPPIAGSPEISKKKAIINL